MILVCGASGTTGGATVAALVTAGAPVRALTRDPAAYAAPAGVEVVAGSFDDADSLARALAGVERAYLVSNETEEGLDRRLAFVDAATAAGVAHVVYLSSIGAGLEELRFARQHGVVEERLRASGMAWTFLRPNGFMQNFLAQSESMREQGALYTPMTAGAAVSHVDAGDIGAMAAAALIEPGHEGREYDVTGPAAITDSAAAAAFGAAFGRGVQHVTIPVEAACGAMLGAGAQPYMVGLMPQLWEFYEQGHGASVSPDVERVLGRPARSFEQFAHDHVPVLGG